MLIQLEGIPLLDTAITQRQIVADAFGQAARVLNATTGPGLEEGSDDLRGGSGDDYLRGGPGTDHIRTGKGKDIVHLSGGKDIIYDFEMLNDKIVIPNDWTFGFEANKNGVAISANLQDDKRELVLIGVDVNDFNPSINIVNNSNWPVDDSQT